MLRNLTRRNITKVRYRGLYRFLQTTNKTGPSPLSSDIKRNGQEDEKFKKKKVVIYGQKNWIYALAGLSLFGFAIRQYYWSTKNQLPYSVAENVRKALWYESDQNGCDYKKALEYYIKAIDELSNNNFDSLADEYTRLELKLAELYERLGMLSESKDVYKEMLSRFYEALLTPNKVLDDRRADLIRKDLRVLIKSLELNKDVEYGKKLLISHLLLVQEEILTKSPELKEFFEDRKKKAVEMAKTTHQMPKLFDPEEFEPFVNEKNIKLDENGYMILDLEKNSSAWEPYKEEFFTARDLYTAYCLSSKDIAAALSCKMTSVEWMVMADMPPGQILLSQANLGSLLYLQAEKFDSDITKLQTKIDEEPELKENPAILKALRYLHKNRDSCIKMAYKSYQSIVKFYKSNSKLRFHTKDQLDPSVVQAIALSTYGLGILNLYDGVYIKAETLLKDAITLSKDTEFVELWKEAEMELKKAIELKIEKQKNEALTKTK
ncbi:Protein MRG3-like [Nakaseomyces bracarensis]|uniref:Protein MRG3-like n=1 Tax=Nakaseomyces bracarensis TaxID=273131 RepID=A0ABR4NUX9_9SACH